MDNGNGSGRNDPRPEDAALEELQRVRLDTSSVTDFLRELSVLAASTVPEAHAGFVLDRGDQAITVAGNDGVVAQLEEIEHACGDGPRHEAMRECARVDMADLAHDDRWGSFVQYALPFGAASGLCLPVVVKGQAIGALAVYAPRPGAFTEDDARTIQAIADQAAAGLTRVLRDHDGLVSDAQLREALAERQVVDRAVGVLMHARNLSSGDALEMLLDMARTSSRTLGDVASGVLDGAGSDGTSS